MKRGFVPILIILVILVIPLSAAVIYFLQQSGGHKEIGAQTVSPWAFEEIFTGNPSSPSQSLLPKRFDYVVTHRTHPNSPDGHNEPPITESYGTFPADHGPDCLGPDPALSNDKIQHQVNTTHRSNTSNPDESFFVCKDHMMSSMGDVEGYSVATFYPRQEFDFNDGGLLEFQSGISKAPGGRTWWEVNIIPRDELQLAAAASEWPIDETYPKNRIVLRLNANQTRNIEVGTGALDPNGEIAGKGEWQSWGDKYPSDPATTDRRIRRLHRVTIENNKIIWATQKQDGTFDEISADISSGLPFKKGLVLFSQHAYTPKKDGNENLYTSHWDNIRFDGPIITPFEGFEAEGVLQMNGVPVGGTKTQTINLPRVGTNAYILGQTHSAVFSEAQLSINGGAYFTPNFHSATKGCWGEGWSTFYGKIDPSTLKVGENTLTWKYGPRVNCNGSSDGWPFKSMAIKAVEIQMDALGGGTGGSTVVNPTPIMSVSPSVIPLTTPTPTPKVTPTPVALPTPIQTPTPTANPSSTNTIINFNDSPLTNKILTGQYPTGIIDWGTNGLWFVSSPWKSFTTKSISFKNSSTKQAQFAFVGEPKTLVSLKAFNGGISASTVKLICSSGNPNKVQIINPNQLMEITTGWTTPCSFIKINSTNGWNTNFDDLVIK